MRKKRIAGFVATVAICLAGTTMSPSAAFGQDPILFVHGYLESSSLWKTMISKFEKTDTRNRP